jgi:adenylate cyclase
MKPDAAGKVIGEKRFLGRYSRRTAMAAIVILVVIAAGLVSWNIYLQQSSKVEPASAEKMAFPLPDKPSIAVLPFENLSGDPKQAYFSDGLTEEIITGLSKVPYLFVIARNSSFTYKGKPVEIRQVAEELGVRYVLEGSFRKDEDKIRVTAQLIDATTGYHLWAERYDRELKNIFSLQDEITMKIMKSLEIRLTEGEQARLDRKGTKNLEAYVKVLQAIDYFRGFNKDDNLLARRKAEEAIALDRQYARAYSMLGWTYIMDGVYGTSKSPAKSMKRAEELANKALSLDESFTQIRELTSYIYLKKRQHEKAIKEAERGFALDPNAADILAHLAMALNYFGRPEEAIEFFKKAIRLNPFPPTFYFHNLGRTYRHLGRYEEAITEVKKALKRSPRNLFAHVELVAAYSLSGRDDESQRAGEELLKIQPNFSVEGFAKNLPYKNKADTDRLIAALRKAGLK